MRASSRSACWNGDVRACPKVSEPLIDGALAVLESGALARQPLSTIERRELATGRELLGVRPVVLQHLLVGERYRDAEPLVHVAPDAQPISREQPDTCGGQPRTALEVSLRAARPLQQPDKFGIHRFHR